ncbi:formimidoyltetrahydrofolate cyclodeaminase [Balamuthia mandrillaris]
MRRSHKLACSYVIVSEGRNQGLLSRMKEAASSIPGAALLSSFSDETYHRSSFTLAGFREPLAQAALSICRLAVQELDLTQHGREDVQAVHPRVGVVDLLPFYPLGEATTLQECGLLAATVGKRLVDEFPARASVAFFGTAHPLQRSLVETRRATNFFSLGGSGQAGGQGLPPGRVEIKESSVIDLGADPVDQRTGLTVCGAMHYALNFNILLDTFDLAYARSIASRVRSSGGGPLPGVQAMALPHKDGVEIACNLLQPEVSSPSQVLQLVQHLLQEEKAKEDEEGPTTNNKAQTKEEDEEHKTIEKKKVVVKHSYTIGLTVNEIYDQAVRALSL